MYNDHQHYPERHLVYKILTVFVIFITAPFYLRQLLRVFSGSGVCFSFLFFFSWSFYQFTVAPQIGPFSFGDEAANAGEMATVQCAVIKGDLPVDIVWSLNGQLIDVMDAQTNQNYDRQDIIVSRSNKRASTLTIDSVAARHAGEYSCTASNAAGSATHTSVLSVNGTICLFLVNFEID